MVTLSHRRISENYFFAVLEELDAEGRDTLFPFIVLLTAEWVVVNKGLPAGTGVGVRDPVVGDELPLVAPIAVHHLPE